MTYEDWIGRTVVREDVATPRIAAQYYATLFPHLFVPRDKGHGCPGVHWCLALSATPIADLGPDGTEAKGEFLPPVSLPRRMWAGGQIETLHPIAIGSHIRRTSRIADVKTREGKAGKLCFVSVSHDIESNGTLAVRERHDIVFRDANKGGTVEVQRQPPPQGDIVWQVEGSPVLLFRFSALTFNGHRIHYDLDHARNIEGYAGLLVHGPLQAALLLNQLSVLKGAVPRHFSYRCVAPLLAGTIFHVASSNAPAGGASGVIADADGIVTIEASAHE